VGATITLSPSQTIGPLYGFALIFQGSEHAVEPQSPDALALEVQVFDAAGPVAYPESMIEIWQGEMWARSRTDADGVARFTVRKPAAVELPDGQAPAPHLNVTVFARGLLWRLRGLRGAIVGPYESLITNIVTNPGASKAPGSIQRHPCCCGRSTPDQQPRADLRGDRDRQPASGPEHHRSRRARLFESDPGAHPSCVIFCYVADSAEHFALALGLGEPQLLALDALGAPVNAFLATTASGAAMPAPTKRGTRCPGEPHPLSKTAPFQEPLRPPIPLRGYVHERLKILLLQSFLSVVPDMVAAGRSSG